MNLGPDRPGEGGRGPEVAGAGAPTLTESRARESRLAVHLAAYIVGALATFGLIRLVHSPDWLSAVTIISSLAGGAANSAVQKKLPDIRVPLSHIIASSLLGIATVVIWTLVSFWNTQNSDIDVLQYITASDNTGIKPRESALFRIGVPSHRDYLTVIFSGTPSPGDRENCINGASLTLVQSYGATVSGQSTIDFDSEYTVAIPPGVTQFTLRATFFPQAGFNECTSDITVKSAYLHN